MPDFFYWNKTGGEGFNGLSVYLKNPINGRPGWYFANYTSYKTTIFDNNNVNYIQMPVRFGIHSPDAPAEDAHKPKKMGTPGDFLIVTPQGSMQIITEHEYGLKFAGKSTKLPGQSVADASITITTGATGMAPASSSMGTSIPVVGSVNIGSTLTVY
jgi:hypothetical protein